MDINKLEAIAQQAIDMSQPLADYSLPLREGRIAEIIPQLHELNLGGLDEVLGLINDIREGRF